jgi:hypothetical protein
VLAWVQGAEGLIEAINATRTSLEEARTQLGAAREALHRGRAGDAALIADARALDRALDEALRALAGDDVRTRRGDVGAPTPLGRAQNAVFGASGNAYGPTGTQREQLAIAEAEFRALEPRLRALVEEEWPAFGRRLDEAGVPWTAGRALPGVR